MQLVVALWWHMWHVNRIGYKPGYSSYELLLILSWMKTLAKCGEKRSMFAEILCSRNLSSLTNSFRCSSVGVMLSFEIRNVKRSCSLALTINMNSGG